MPDYYAILNVEPDATGDEIKRSYRHLVREHHPDIAPEGEDAHARIQLILEAYGVLGNTQARARYDRELVLKGARREPPAASRPHAETNERTRPGDFSTAQDQFDEFGVSLGPRARRGTPAASSAGMPVPEVVRRARSAQAARERHEGDARAHNPRTRLLTMVFEAAQLFFFESRAEEAAALCHRVLKADPRNPEAAALLGDIYLAQERRDLALLMFERAMRAQPSNLLYKQKWNALRRGEPVPPSNFARPQDTPAPTAAPADFHAAPAEAAPDRVVSAAAAPSPEAETPRSRLHLAPVEAPVAPKKPLLGRLFGRGK